MNLFYYLRFMFYGFAGGMLVNLLGMLFAVSDLWFLAIYIICLPFVCILDDKFVSKTDLKLK